MFKPEIINSLKGYNGKKFVSDLTAGIIVGIVALPLSIAFAIASGASPERGIFTAIIAGFIISVFGGSAVQIGGPTGAFVIIIYNVIEQFGYSGLITATLMAGILLILLGVFKMGGLISFIPHTIVTGFTAGIAVTIFTTQVGDFFGLSTGKMPGEFIEKIAVYAHSFSTINFWALGTALVSLVLIFLWPKVTKRIPGSLIVIILATLICTVFKLPVDTIGSRFGEIPSSLPAPTLPHISFKLITDLFPTAVSIAILAAVESLLSAVVADGMIGKKHNSNTELIAQGIANLASPLFGGLPATGAIARTATNIKNGGRTPVAGIIHAVTLLLIMLFLGKFAVYIPMPALAAVLVSVSWNMAGFSEIRSLCKGQKSDILVLFTTFIITIFVDLPAAIGVGLILAAFLFIKKMIELSEIHEQSRGNTDKNSADHLSKSDIQEDPLDIPEGVLVYEIDGPLFFGTAQKFEQAVEKSGIEFKVLIIRMRKMIYIDAGGIYALRQVHELCNKRGVQIIISGIHTQPYTLLHKSGFAKELGEEFIFAKIEHALGKAGNLVEEK
ncbi:MAG TPA: sulfate permease [Treponemataceae bacterium]|nr:sulfate permease [Treponemataceae bacterium]